MMEKPVSDRAATIMDAAERRIRRSGYEGFSFREIAEEVGVKSASVHYHFPTKELLAAAVARRYADRFVAGLEASIRTGLGPVEACSLAFGRSFHDDGRVCLCAALGAFAEALSDDVAAEVRRFFNLTLDTLTTHGVSRPQAIHALAALEGAMVMARALSDPHVLDEVIAQLSQGAPEAR